jgi:hypothetical protein
MTDKEIIAQIKRGVKLQNRLNIAIDRCVEKGEHWFEDDKCTDLLEKLEELGWDFDSNTGHAYPLENDDPDLNERIVKIWHSKDWYAEFSNL